MKDIEKLLNATLPFVEDLLRNYGEFFPLASAVYSSGKIAQIGTYDRNERPKSADVINDLKRSLKSGARNGDYIAIAIFYDVRALNPHTGNKTDAIAVFAENKTDNTAYTFYYPYTLTLDRQLALSKSWGNKAQKEIFGS